MIMRFRHGSQQRPNNMRKDNSDPRTPPVPTEPERIGGIGSSEAVEGLRQVPEGEKSTGFGPRRENPAVPVSDEDEGHRG